MLRPSDSRPSPMRALYRGQIHALGVVHDAEECLWLLRDAQCGRETIPLVTITVEQILETREVRAR